MAFIKNEAAFQCKGIGQNIVINEIISKCFTLRTIPCRGEAERKRGRSREGRKKTEADSKGKRINSDRPQAAGEAI